MPASSINFYHMQDAKNNFDAIRPAPICTDANYFMGQCRNLHISTNCYYGYHNSSHRSETIQDTEMVEITNNVGNPLKIPPVIDINTRKRCAEENEHSRSKRVRQEDGFKVGGHKLSIFSEVQTMKKHGPETNENLKLDSTSEELMATLYWHIHGGNFYQYLSSICSLVGTRSSPSHSASAFNANIIQIYSLFLIFKLFLVSIN